MAEAAKVRISRGRAQDWISSVLNPIIDGLRRELSFLPDGPWRWLPPPTRRFEYLVPLDECVAEIYRDNYEDFLAKFPKLRPSFRKHDRHLAELSGAVDRAYERLMSSHEGGPLRQGVVAALRSAGATDPDDDLKWFAAYLAGGFVEIPRTYAHHDVYNRLGEIRRTAEAIVRRERAEARAGAQRLMRSAVDLHDRLVALRMRLADRFGARIVPVGGVDAEGAWPDR